MGYRWVDVCSRAEFAARDGAGAMVFDGRMWLLGGWNPNDKDNFPCICNSEVWSSTDGARWSLVTKQAPWEGRHYAGYVVHDGWMWIVGGDPNQGHYQQDVWRSRDGVSWEQVTDAVPWAPRVFAHTVAQTGKMFVIGGQTLPQFAGGEHRIYDDVWVSGDGVDWEQLAVVGPHFSPRALIGGHAVFGDRIWLLGGGTYDTPTAPERVYYNDVWSSVDGVEWQCHTPSAPWPPRQMHEVAVFDGKLWVMEGYNGMLDGNRNDVWYSSDGVEWHELPDTPWKPRHAASVFVYDDALWMVAGNNMESDVWKLVRS